MNVIFILLDSLNRHYLSCYGNSWIKTPNIQRLSNKGVVFDNHFISSAPCMPARREMFTGRKEFLWRGWGPVEPFDELLAVRARKDGIRSALITDHYHYWDGTNGYGYAQQFDFYEMLRGQEADSWGHLRDVENIPRWVQAITNYRREEVALHYYKNVCQRQNEWDFDSPRVMTAACNWLKENSTGKDQFLLVIESFDPHEPWYIPEPFRSMYGPYNEEYTCWPPYQRADESQKFRTQASVEEVEHIRNQYAGKITMVDKHLGRVFDALDELELWDDTIVILTTDHGHELAEKGRFGKSYPHWNTSAHIPLIIWDPRHPGDGARASTFSCTVDIYPTILEGLGVKDCSAPDGSSLLPAVEKPDEMIREAVLYGEFSRGAGLVNAEYTYFSGYDNDNYPVYWYSCQLPRGVVKGDINKVESGRYMPDVDVPLWRMPVEHYLTDGSLMLPEALYRYRGDHAQEQNIVELDTEGLSRCRQQMVELLMDAKAPPEQFARLGLDRS